MWGRLFLSAVLVVLIIVWLVAIYLMIVDPRTVRLTTSPALPFLQHAVEPFNRGRFLQFVGPYTQDIFQIGRIGLAA
jgi:hypothetical protein